MIALRRARGLRFDVLRADFFVFLEVFFMSPSYSRAPRASIGA